MGIRVPVPPERTEPSVRELQVLLAYAETGSTVAAGKRLGLVPQTVRNHLLAIHRCLKVETSVQAVWQLRHRLEALDVA